MILLKFDDYLPVMFYLISLHSLVIGMCLIYQPNWLIQWLGAAEFLDPFFPSQSGVFHICMALAYAMAGAGFSGLIFFSMVVKGCGLLFLLGYYVLCRKRTLYLLSGLLDGFMGLAFLAALQC